MGRTDCLSFAGLGKPHFGILANGLQQAIPDADLIHVRIFDHHHRLGHKPAQKLEDVALTWRDLGPQSLGRLDRPATREDGEPAQQGALFLGHELVAPVDGRLQCLPASYLGSIATGQQSEPLIESCGDLLHSEHAEAGRRKLDR
jgi:hypothetical protein